MTEPYNYNKNPEGIAIENMTDKKDKGKKAEQDYRQTTRNASLDNNRKLTKED